MARSIAEGVIHVPKKLAVTHNRLFVCGDSGCHGLKLDGSPLFVVSRIPALGTLSPALHWGRQANVVVLGDEVVVRTSRCVFAIDAADGCFHRWALERTWGTVCVHDGILALSDPVGRSRLFYAPDLRHVERGPHQSSEICACSGTSFVWVDKCVVYRADASEHWPVRRPNGRARITEEK
jgi:hypothetical protein